MSVMRHFIHNRLILNGPIQRSICRPFHVSDLLSKVIPFKLSDIGEGIAEVQVKEWHINVGDNINEFDEVCSVQSDKATVTITSRYQGTVKKLHFNVDDMAKVGQPLIDIDVKDNEVEMDNLSADRKEMLVEHQDVPHSTSSSKKFLATPSVRRLIRENNIDLVDVSGTGKDGRILKEDLLRHLGVTNTTTKKEPLEAKNGISPEVQETRIPIRGYTRGMIKSMTESLKIPHFGYNDEFVADNLIHLKNELNKFAERRDQSKITYMPIIIKATSLALKEFPILNSSIDESFTNIIYKSYHNISLAMDTPGGLVVPNIKNCHQKSVWQIAADLNRLLDLGKKQNFSKEDLSDGTFSLSNIGAIGGGTYMKPIIFAPQVAIGAIGRIQKLPRFDANDNLVKRSILKFSWAADHRVIDGATMARFSNHLKEYIESPSLMMAELC